MFFRDLQSDYETLNVAIDPNVSWKMSELITTHIACKRTRDFLLH